MQHTFAKGLVNLSNKQDEQGVERTIGRLKKLINKQDEQSIERIIELLNL